MKQKIVPLKSDESFKKMLDSVRIERIKLGKSIKLVPYPRLTLAISRIPNLKNILINADII